jgi:predicted HicB family RNase H-like nuclease
MHATATPTEKSQEALNYALAHFHKKPNWIVFFREVLGQRGIVRRLYPNKEALVAFEKTSEYQEIQEMLSQLRKQPEGQDGQDEPCKVITVRLPKSMHEALKDEAHTYSTSMNQLCISKLLQIIDAELVPGDDKTK